jgi:hypothetical protein
MNARMGMAEKLSIQQLTKAVQDGTVPSFIGIPLIQQKMKEQQGAAAMQPKAPPIAQQVLQQAMATEGVQALPSNMPQEYAHGGILSYADGGDIYDDDEYDPEDYAQEYALSQGEDLMDQYYADRGEYEVDRSTGEAPSMYERKSGPGIESLREVRVSPSGRSIEAKEEKVQVGDGTSEKLLKHILHKESRGRRYDKEGNLLTSSKGAMGEMQVMPATARDPGFGITPARGNDPDELRRVGEEYAKVLLNRYRDPKLAAIAYNWGPGNTDKWLSSGADMSKLPQETRGYIQNMAGGGAVHFQKGGFNDIFNMSPDEVKEYAKRKLRLDQLKSAFTPDPVVPATPAAVPAAVAEAPSFLDRAKTGIKGLASKLTPSLGNLNIGAALALHSPELNSNETAELERRRKMGFDTAGAGRGATNPNDPRLVSSPNFAAQTQNSAFNPAVTKPSPYDIEDMEAGQGAEAAAAAAAALQQQAKKEEPAAETTSATPDYASGIGQLLSKREAGLGKQRDIDNYMALLSAGLGMMGGTSPFAGANIGQGAQAGIKTFADSQARRVAEENAILSGRLGEYRYAGSRAQADALMQLRKDMQKENVALAKEKIKSGELSKQEANVLKKDTKELEYIKSAQERALTAAATAVGNSPNSMTMTESQRAEAIRKMADGLLMPDKIYRKYFQTHHDIDPFASMGGGTMSSERASKFKVERP